MSQLKTKLNALRRQTAQTGAPITTAAELPSVAERIRRAQLKKQQAEADKFTECQLAQALEAEIIEEGLILKESRLALCAQHGDVCLDMLRSVSQQKLPFADVSGLEDLVFLDTETTGLAGGTGTLVFLLGMARVEQHELVLRQYLLAGFAGEKAMLEHAQAWLSENITLVTFNGKTFDIPLLNSRYRLQRVDTPFTSQSHIDLMHPLRRAFANKWSDCRLQTAERRLLNYHRENDMPGSEAPEAWFEWVRLSRHQRLLGIMEHNYWDVVSLAALLPALAGAFASPDSHDADIHAIARGLLNSDQISDAYRLLTQNEANLTHNGLLELARLHRRHDEWDAAVLVWQRLAENDCLESIEALAKYYEHKAKNLRMAQEKVTRLVQLDRANPEHLHRQQRIRQKLVRGV